MSGFIHLSQWSSWEDFFVGMATTTKKLTDKPKTWGVWQSTGFSSLKQHRLSRHAGWEQVWFSIWWSDYHKLPLIFFLFLLVFLLLFAIKISVLDIQSFFFLLQRIFGIIWNQLILIQSCKEIQQRLQFKLWVFEKTQNQISTTQLCAHTYFILWQHHNFITEQLSLCSSSGD